MQHSTEAYGITRTVYNGQGPRTYHLRRARSDRSLCGREIIPARSRPADAAGCTRCQRIRTAEAGTLPPATIPEAADMWPEGTMLDRLTPEGTEALMAAAEALYRAHTGAADPQAEIDRARQRTEAAATLIQPYMGSRVSYTGMLSLMWWVAAALAETMRRRPHPPTKEMRCCSPVRASMGACTPRCGGCWPRTPEPRCWPATPAPARSPWPRRSASTRGPERW